MGCQNAHLVGRGVRFGIGAQYIMQGALYPSRGEFNLCISPAFALGLSGDRLEEIEQVVDSRASGLYESQLRDHAASTIGAVHRLADMGNACQWPVGSTRWWPDESTHPVR